MYRYSTNMRRSSLEHKIWLELAKFGQKYPGIRHSARPGFITDHFAYGSLNRLILTAISKSPLEYPLKAPVSVVYIPINVSTFL